MVDDHLRQHLQFLTLRESTVGYQQLAFFQSLLVEERGEPGAACNVCFFAQVAAFVA